MSKMEMIKYKIYLSYNTLKTHVFIHISFPCRLLAWSISNLKIILCCVINKMYFFFVSLSCCVVIHFLRSSNVINIYFNLKFSPTFSYLFFHSSMDTLRAKLRCTGSEYQLNVKYVISV